MGCRAALVTLVLAAASTHVNPLSYGDRPTSKGPPEPSEYDFSVAETTRPPLRPSKTVKFSVNPTAVHSSLAGTDSKMYTELKSRNYLDMNPTTVASDLTWPPFVMGRRGSRAQNPPAQPALTVPPNLRRATFKTMNKPLTLVQAKYEQAEEDLLLLRKQKDKLRSLQASLRQARMRRVIRQTTYNPRAYYFTSKRHRPIIPIAMARGLPRGYFRKYPRMPFTRSYLNNSIRRVTFKTRQVSTTEDWMHTTITPKRRVTFKVNAKATVGVQQSYKWLFDQHMTYKPASRVTFKTYEGSTVKPFRSVTFKSYSSITFLPKMMRYRRITFKSYPRKYAWENMPKKDQMDPKYHTFMQPKSNQFYRDKWLQRGPITYKPLGTTTARALGSMKFELDDAFD